MFVSSAKTHRGGGGGGFRAAVKELTSKPIRRENAHVTYDVGFVKRGETGSNKNEPNLAVMKDPSLLIYIYTMSPCKSGSVLLAIN